MSKINNVILKISDNTELIEDVYESEDEYYFRFGGIAFSLRNHLERESIVKFGKHTLYVYPKWEGPFAELDNQFSTEPGSVKYIAYHGVNLPPGIQDRLQLIYKTLEEKASGLDETFDKLLNL